MIRARVKAEQDLPQWWFDCTCITENTLKASEEFLVNPAQIRKMPASRCRTCGGKYPPTTDIHAIDENGRGCFVTLELLDLDEGETR